MLFYPQLAAQTLQFQIFVLVQILIKCTPRPLVESNNTEYWDKGPCAKYARSLQSIYLPSRDRRESRFVLILARNYSLNLSLES